FGSQRTVNVAGARENVGSPIVQQTGIQCFNCKEFEKGVPLQAEQSIWLADTDEEIGKQELKAHYSYMEKIQEVPTADSGTDSEPLEQVQYNDEYNVFANVNQHYEQSKSTSNLCLVENDDSDVTPDSSNMCEHDIQTDQNAEDERNALANLIANLKLDVDENKKIQKQLKKENTSLAYELEQCKSILIKTSKTLKESNSVRDSFLVTLQTKQNEFEKYKACNDRTVDYDKLKFVKEKHDKLVKQSLLTKSHYEGLVKEKIKTIQTIHMLAPKGPTFNGRPTFANLMYLKKSHFEKPCLYEILNDQFDPTNKLVPDREETLTIAEESRSKLNKDFVRPHDYTRLNSLYEIFKPAPQGNHKQLAHASEVRKKIWRKSFVKVKPNIFKNIDFLPVLKSVSKSQQAYNVMTNNINHFKEIIDQAWVKHSMDHISLRHLTAHDIQIPIKTCLMPLALKTQNDSLDIVYELKQEMHADLKYVESLKKEIDDLESDKAEFSNMYNTILVRTHLQGSLPHGSDRIKGVKGLVTGIVRARLYSSKYVTMGCTSFICQEEGW
nr:hypothetical protein [Tanacetum cinerariifolium]